MPELPILVFTPDLIGLLSLVINVLLPLGVSLITTRVTSSSTKGLLLLLLAAVKVVAESALRAAVDGASWEFIPVIMNVVISFGVAVAAYYGYWKHTQLQTSLTEDHGRKSP